MKTTCSEKGLIHYKCTLNSIINVQMIPSTLYLCISIFFSHFPSLILDTFSRVLNPVAFARSRSHGTPLPAPVSSLTCGPLKCIKCFCWPWISLNPLSSFCCTFYLSCLVQAVLSAVNAFSHLVFTWLSFILLLILSWGVDSCSRSFLIPKTGASFCASLVFCPQSVLTPSQFLRSIIFGFFTHATLKSLRTRSCHLFLYLQNIVWLWAQRDAQYILDKRVVEGGHPNDTETATLLSKGSASQLSPCVRIPGESFKHIVPGPELPKFWFSWSSMRLECWYFFLMETLQMSLMCSQG